MTYIVKICAVKVFGKYFGNETEADEKHSEADEKRSDTSDSYLYDHCRFSIMEINADLHIHSRYAAACSDQMTPEVIAEQAARKGIHLVGTGDCLHPRWFAEIKKYAEDDETIVCGKTRFIPTVEIEDRNKVHHLLILPSLSKAAELAQSCMRFGNPEADGRPALSLSGEEIGDLAADVGALFGPCHAFTPWTGLYGTHDSLKDCYGDRAKDLSFLELGLSADSAYADRISDIRRLTYLSSSDAHSPWTNKLGREFTRFSVPDTTFDGLRAAILRKRGYNAVLNVGFYPQEGKYHDSACISPDCNLRYSLSEAVSYKWKCPECRSKITKGVSDRVNELADLPEKTPSPEWRPPYRHIIPLAEIIMRALNHKSISTKGVSAAYETLVAAFGTEIDVLLNDDPEKTIIADPVISDAIRAFRNNEIEIYAGGGGQYGCLEFVKRPTKETKQNNADKSIYIKNANTGEESLRSGFEDPENKDGSEKAPKGFVQRSLFGF